MCTKHSSSSRSHREVWRKSYFYHKFNELPPSESDDDLDPDENGDVTGWHPMKPPAVPEADFAVHASVYGELLVTSHVRKVKAMSYEDIEDPRAKRRKKKLSQARENAVGSVKVLR